MNEIDAALSIAVLVFYMLGFCVGFLCGLDYKRRERKGTK